MNPPPPSSFLQPPQTKWCACQDTPNAWITRCNKNITLANNRCTHFMLNLANTLSPDTRSSRHDCHAYFSTLTNAGNLYENYISGFVTKTAPNVISTPIFSVSGFWEAWSFRLQNLASIIFHSILKKWSPRWICFS